MLRQAQTTWDGRSLRSHRARGSCTVKRRIPLWRPRPLDRRSRSPVARPRRRALGYTLPVRTQQPPAPHAQGSERLHVVAPVDADPVALLISSLATRTRFANMSLDLLAPVPLSGECTRLARLLHSRGIETTHRVVKPKDFLRKELPLEVADRSDGAVAHALDVSGATSETALRAYEAAARAWPSGFLVASFHPLRNSVRYRNHGPLAAVPDQLIGVDIGSPADLPGGEIRPEELLELFDLRVLPEDPYGLDVGVSSDSERLLVEAAAGVLTAFTENEPEYRAFRRDFATAHRASSVDVALAERAFPAAMQATVRALIALRLVSRHAGGDVVLAGPGDRGAGFFLAGGWLEIAVTHILGRSFPDHRTIVRNTGTAWGNGDVPITTYAETDAAFILDNRLFVVSCKNEFNEERLYRHLDRLRALVAEFGETHVRPVLLSTEALSDRAAMRCRAYEVAALTGPELLQALAADMAARQPHKLLGWLTQSAVGTPGPGLAG